MNPEHLAPLVLLQVVNAVALTVLLFHLKRQLNSEQHIFFWACAWLATVLNLTYRYFFVQLGAEYSARGTYDQSAVQVAVFAAFAALGWLQPALMLLAAWSLRSGPVDRKLAWRVCLAGPVVGILLEALGTALQFGAIPTNLLVTATRMLLSALTTLAYAWALHRHYRRFGTTAGRMVVACCGAYGLHLFMVSMILYWIPRFGHVDSPAHHILGALFPLALSVALVISVMEGAEVAKTRLGQTWDSSADGMRLCSSDGRILWVNEAYCRVVGQRREELEGKPFDDSFQPEDRAGAREKFCAFANGDAAQERVRESLRLRGGRRIHFDLSHSVLDTALGRQIFTEVRDMTAEQEAVEALKRSEERFQAALDIVNDAVFDWRPLTGEVFVSGSLYRLLGLDPNATVTSPEAWLRLVHSDDLDRTNAALRSMLSGQQDRFALQYRIRAGERGFIQVLSRGAVYESDENGRAIRVVGVISERAVIQQPEPEHDRMQDELSNAQKPE